VLKPRRPFLTAAFATCLFGLVLGAKWAVVDRFGSAMPDWDHFLAHLFLPHNEHRIVPTKLQNLALALLNGQWDARLECVANAALHAALAVACWLLVDRWLRRLAADSAAGSRSHTAGWKPALLPTVLFILTAVLFGAPLAWQNILGGFHSQQYWLLGLSFAVIVAWPWTQPWRAGWWVALLTAALALVSMGSGFLASAVVFGILVVQWIGRETTLRRAWPTFVATIALTAVGWFTHVEVYYHQPLKAHTAHDFLLSIVRSLEWPLRDFEWTAAILWAPWVIVTWQVLRRRWSPTSPSATGVSRDADAHHSGSRAELTIFAVGGWVLLQIIATAYARGAGGDWPASRYMDTLAFGAWINAAALAWLIAGPKTRDQGPKTNEQPPPASPRVFGLRSLVFGLLALAWLVPLGCGLVSTLQRNLRYELPDAKKYYIKAESHVRGFLATNDRAQLAFDDIPYPSADGLIERLAHPSIRALMPVVVRPPLPLASAAAADSDMDGTPVGANAVSPPMPDHRPPFLPNQVSQLQREPLPRRGLSPTSAPLASLPTWGSFAAGTGTGAAATGEWRSATVQLPAAGDSAAPFRGWLKFETAGELGRPDEPQVGLYLVDAQTGARLAEIRPAKVPGDTWRAAYVRVPPVPFAVVAIDDSPTGWLAFSAPVEMGPLSYWAWQCAKNGLLVAEISAGVSLALALLWLAKARAKRRLLESGRWSAPTLPLA
jgi:hypothetical protein